MQFEILSDLEVLLLKTCSIVLLSFCFSISSICKGSEYL